MRVKRDLGKVSTHSRPKAAGSARVGRNHGEAVSTHSRPKAAGRPLFYGQQRFYCFNTQPPEGGWLPRVGGRWQGA